MLTRDQILSSDDIKREPLEVPEWGGIVYIKTMMGDDRDSFEQSQIDANGKSKSKNLRGFRARLAVATVCDEAGNNLFTEKDIAALGKKSGAALSLVLDVAFRLNRFSEQHVEELVKNSDAAPNEGSISA